MNRIRTYHIDGTHKLEWWKWEGQDVYYPMYYKGGEWHYYKDPKNKGDSLWFATYGGGTAFFRNRRAA